MQTATLAERAQTKIRKASIPRTEVAKQSTFLDWLTEEAAAGRMILATGNGKGKLTSKPKETIDFWPAYNEVRADRF